jgi:hypothetical protein
MVDALNHAIDEEMAKILKSSCSVKMWLTVREAFLASLAAYS